MLMIFGMMVSNVEVKATRRIHAYVSGEFRRSRRTKCCPMLTHYQRVPGLLVKGAVPTLVGLLLGLAELFSQSGVKARVIVVEYAEGFGPQAHTQTPTQTHTQVLNKTDVRWQGLCFAV